MWTTFKDCLNSIISNIDDFAVIIFILIVGNKLAELLYLFLAKFMNASLFVAQTVKLTLQIFIGVISFVHLVGSDVITNASAGIAIGVGYAFQPYIISMFNGLMLHNDNLITKDNWLDVPSQSISGGKVHSIGLFNTVLIDEWGNQILISNSSLTRAAVTVHCKSPWATNPSMKDKFVVKCPKSEHGWTKGDDTHKAQHFMNYNIHHNPSMRNS